MMKLLTFVLSAVLLSGCQSLSAPPPPEFSAEKLTLNPSGNAPLTALLEVQSDRPVRAEIKVAKKFMGGGNENASDTAGDLTFAFEQLTTEHRIPILGLYADRTNTVRITFYDERDRQVGEREYTVTTEPLIEDMPSVRIDIAQRKKMSDGWTMVGYRGRKKGNPTEPHQPFLFDSRGDIRWYLSLRGHPKLDNLNYEVGFTRLANGNLFFASRYTDIIFEMDMLGNIIREWSLPGFGFHHHIIEKPDGNFLMTAEKPKNKTSEDWVIETARSDGAVVRAWDLKESLQYSRRDMVPGMLKMAPADKDWFHGNGLAYLPAADSFLVSGRTQSAVAKINADNEAVWILAPHRGWGVAGNGDDLSARLLQPLDAAGVPISDEAVLTGKKAHPDFDWNWYQHSPILMPNGNIMIFDNGENRHYQSGGRYSRAVAYAIDEEAMTVRQVWEWGRERGRNFYSQFVSGVEYIAATDNVIVSSGRIVGKGSRVGKVVELDYKSREVIFEATVDASDRAADHIFHRTFRMPIYPP